MTGCLAWNLPITQSRCQSILESYDSDLRLRPVKVLDQDADDVLAPDLEYEEAGDLDEDDDYHVLDVIKRPGWPAPPEGIGKEMAHFMYLHATRESVFRFMNDCTSRFPPLIEGDSTRI